MFAIEIMQYKVSKTLTKHLLPVSISLKISRYTIKEICNCFTLVVKLFVNRWPYVTELQFLFRISSIKRYTAHWFITNLFVCLCHSHNVHHHLCSLSSPSRVQAGHFNWIKTHQSLNATTDSFGFPGKTCQLFGLTCGFSLTWFYKRNNFQQS